MLVVVEWSMIAFFGDFGRTRRNAGGQPGAALPPPDVAPTLPFSRPPTSPA